MAISDDAMLDILTKRVAELDARSRELMKQPFSIEVCEAVCAFNTACEELAMFKMQRNIY